MSAVPLIQMTGVTREYGRGSGRVVALRGVDLRIGSGDYVAIVGRSGSGKSTLLHLLGLLDTLSFGRYEFDGTPVGELSERAGSELRGRRIGFVFQAFYLLPHRTALENVMLAGVYNRTSRRDRAERAREALVGVGLGHRLHALPSTLSGGEQQRVALARAVVGEPDLLLLDEPTGNLDSANAAGVVDLLEGLHARGITVVLATHDRDIAARADRQIVVRDGRLAT
jgi:putative ABC transport system ATP-binding protein